MELFTDIMIAVLILSVLACVGLLLAYFVVGPTPEADADDGGHDGDESDESDDESEEPAEPVHPELLMNPQVEMVMSAQRTIDPFTGNELVGDEELLTLPLPGDQSIILGLPAETVSMLNGLNLFLFSGELRKLEGNYSIQCRVFIDGSVCEIPGAELYNILVGGGDFEERIALIDELRAQVSRQYQPDAFESEDVDTDDPRDTNPDFEPEILEDSVLSAQVISPEDSDALDMPIDEPVHMPIELEDEPDEESTTELTEDLQAEAEEETEAVDVEVETDEVEEQSAETPDVAEETAKAALVASAMEQRVDAMLANGLPEIQVRNPKDLTWAGTTPLPQEIPPEERRVLKTCADVAPPALPSVDWDPDDGLSNW